MKNLGNIQWHYIRYTGITALTLTVMFLLLFLTDVSELAIIYSFTAWDGMPTVLLWLIVSLVTALGIGWHGGRRQKDRIDFLIESTMALEKGDFSKRSEIEGDDEISVMSNHLNAVAARLEEQAGSMQKLTAERAEWQLSIKQAAAEDERQRLARELHDAVSQQLFAISMTTSALKKTLEKDKEKGMQQAVLIEKMAGTAQGEMRALLMHLRPFNLEGKGLKEGLENLLEELSEKTNLQINWNIENEENLGRGIEDHLFRISQEALSNILRHAQAHQVHMQLKVFHGQLRMKIIDDGIGFQLDKDQKQSSYGLSTMKERVTELGGVIHILSYPGKGTQVEVTVPVVRRQEEEISVD
ncbi:histidine kinase [Alteribacillus sp. HJP-4]|uniref:sensor histidine kinase n=1 Tax=Alteribacillus sp. HJP-4 TaxID=2775394 RepID=UPI0035CD1462